MIYDSQSGDFNLVVTGDSMVSRKLTPFTEKNYLAIRDICQGADATFTNLESTVREPDEGIHDMSVGTMMTTPPHLLEDLKWLGVNMVSTANNHATDFGHDGLVATSMRLCSRSFGGTSRPFLRSAWRCPRIGRSTVTNSAVHPAAFARSITLSLNLRSLNT